MFSYLKALFNDPKATIIFILLAFPGRIMAIALHEYAHAWVANRCGDPTAKNLGRLTINPAKHLDLLGTIMMLLIGFGWAKPVPVNPLNYRNYRKDDLKVSLAGVVMNLTMFLLGYIVMSAMICAALRTLPHYDSIIQATGDRFVTMYSGSKAMITGGYYYPIASMFQGAMHMNDYLITPVFGRMVGYFYMMVSYFTQVNIVLAVFNLIPMPPLDGYHVLNDLLLKRPLFANPRTARNAQMILMLLVFSGILGMGLAYVDSAICTGVGKAIYTILNLIGLI